MLITGGIILAETINVTMQTTMGDIKLELYPDVAPKTVANFVQLANGTKEFTDPQTNEKIKRAFYDGIKFHRVIS
ncbi:MAG: peptidylprolyl isomerase, partial [Candidatus Cloacimonetes bacterium]|nr:peptidylprolyl isomerase [Candidatus Cloacimonadota bacterium]